MHYSQIIKRVDSILWIYNIVHTAGMSNVQNCFTQTLSLHGSQERGAEIPRPVHLHGTVLIHPAKNQNVRANVNCANAKYYSFNRHVI